MKTSSPTHEEISEQAYQIYLRKGSPDDQALEHWLEAEAELSQSSSDAPQAAEGGSSNGSTESARPATSADSGSSQPAASAAEGRKAPSSGSQQQEQGSGGKARAAAGKKASSTAKETTSAKVAQPGQVAQAAASPELGNALKATKSATAEPAKTKGSQKQSKPGK